MEPSSPARLYAAVAGALLVVLGIVGFFYDASFAGLDDLEPALGVLEVNAWINLLYVLTGAIGVLLAGVASRPYAISIGCLYTSAAIVGWGSEGVHLVIGLLGLAAAAGTPRAEPRRRLRGSQRTSPARKERRSSESRAEPVRDRA